MQLSELPKSKVRALFTDLDGTLTDHGPISPETYRCLWALKEKGFWLVIVSGRPAGWADSLIRLWPVDAVIFENGAGILVRGDEKPKLLPLADSSDLPTQQRKLREIFEHLKHQVPQLKLASDQPYRLFDYAIDFREDPPFLTAAELDQVLHELSAIQDITFKLSSIHINYWIGKHTKLTACQRLIDTEGKSRSISKREIVFSGDSPNDEPLFGFFDYSVGVANVSDFASRLRTPPKYVVRSKNGAGFQELVSYLLS